MHRDSVGSYEQVTVFGDDVQAFVPAPLPPTPPVDLWALMPSYEVAQQSLSELNGLTSSLPNANLLLYAYIRREAVISSQIEGTQSTLADLLQYELDSVPGVPLEDVEEVSNNVAAITYGIESLENGAVISGDLLCRTHGVLLRGGRGSELLPGQYRDRQVWIGQGRPRHAIFIPPPHIQIQRCMIQLDQFVQATDDSLPTLLRAGLAHAQFETIHPFLDGNGRVGRILITLMLHETGILLQPVLYLSLFFKRYRNDYYHYLNQIRTTGDWEAWLEYFLRGVHWTARDAADTTYKLTQMFENHRRQITAQGRRASAALKAHQALTSRPLLNIRELARLSDLSLTGAANAAQLLMQLGIVSEISGQQRNRLFAYSSFIELLSGE